MPTLREIAERLGVSVATVSAVVNNRGYVSPSMRDRITAALEDADRRSDENANSARLGSTRTVGLIVPDLTNSFYARLMRGAEDYLSTLDYRVLVADSREEWERQRSYLLSMAARRTDGILLVPCRAPGEPIGNIGGQLGNMPVVYVDRTPVHGAATSVVPDNVRAGFTATQHLLGLGHRRVAIISEPLDVPDGTERLDGYKKALSANGVSLDEDLVCFGDNTQDSGYRRALDLLRLPYRPSAILVCNNLMTLGLLAALRETGLSCPEDVSVVGFDDFEWCPHLSPPLSMIRVPAAELGEAAAKALIRRLRGIHTNTEERILLESKLVLRQSTAAPNSARLRVMATA